MSSKSVIPKSTLAESLAKVEKIELLVTEGAMSMDEAQLHVLGEI